MTIVTWVAAWISRVCAIEGGRKKVGLLRLARSGFSTQVTTGPPDYAGRRHVKSKTRCGEPPKGTGGRIDRTKRIDKVSNKLDDNFPWVSEGFPAEISPARECQTREGARCAWAG